VGRFISRDPIGIEDGPNLYSYAQSNPVTFIDQFGTEASNGGSCPPKKSWDEKIRDALNKLKKIPDWMLKSKSAKWLKKGYEKLTKLEKWRDDAQSVYENLKSPDPADALDAIGKGSEYIPQAVPLTPVDLVKETAQQGAANIKAYGEGLNPTPNGDERLRDRYYAIHGDQY
jgi:uncharacterized protein RhaS with RHS repeats